MILTIFGIVIIVFGLLVGICDYSTKRKELNLLRILWKIKSDKDSVSDVALVANKQDMLYSIEKGYSPESRNYPKIKLNSYINEVILVSSTKAIW